MKLSSSSQFANDQIFIKLKILKTMNHIRELKNENENINVIKLICDAKKDWKL